MNKSFRIQVLDMEILLHPWAAPPVVALASVLDLSTLDGSLDSFPLKFGSAP